jgi:hypothetical protein
MRVGDERGSVLNYTAAADCRGTGQMHCRLDVTAGHGAPWEQWGSTVGLVDIALLMPPRHVISDQGTHC